MEKTTDEQITDAEKDLAEFEEHYAVITSPEFTGDRGGVVDANRQVLEQKRRALERLKERKRFEDEQKD